MNQLASRSRIQSIDLLRGIVMVIMALDHVRDFFFKTVLDRAANAAVGPTDMQTTFPLLFFTRWITHYCAPVFLLLAGTSIYLMSLKKSKKELSIFLFKRGFWLICVELFIITMGWSFNIFYNVFVLQVIWAIGVSMMIMGLIIQLPFKLILVLGIIIVFGHNLFDLPAVKSKLNNGSTFMDLLYYSQFAIHKVWDDHVILIVYAFLPWTGVMILGYCLGKWFEPTVDAATRQKRLITTGVLLIVIFLVVRFINGYGDPVPWAEQPRGTVYTFLSFLNVNKYPPSLSFLTMTIGPALILLALLENAKNRITDFFNVYGRVPMFYYILHFFIIHTLVVIVFYASGYGANDIVPPNKLFFFRPNDFGFNLWGVYAVWIFVVLILYPACKWYDRYKSTHKQWWLQYI